MAAGQVSVAFSHDASVWYFGLRPDQRERADERLRELARDPERAPFRFQGPGGPIYVAIVDVGDAQYRVDFVIDHLMQKRAVIPAIAVRRAMSAPRR